MSIYNIIAILAFHFLGDFIFQTSEEATKKSTDIHVLIDHTLKYCWGFVFYCAGYCFTNAYNWNIFLLVPITFAIHTLQDFYTSKVSSELFKKEDKRQFFIHFGFDQILHYIQLFVTISILSKK